MKSRIYLPALHMIANEFELVRDAFATNWIAPLGPHVDGFEWEFGQILQGAMEEKNAGTSVGTWSNNPMHCAALSSGTAALHFALKLAGLHDRYLFGSRKS